MSIRVGVEMGVPGVINGPSDEFALAATAIVLRLPTIIGLCRIHDMICWRLDERSMGGGRTSRDALREDRSMVDWAANDSGGGMDDTTPLLSANLSMAGE
jgi:hypothetical protein